MTFHIVEPQLQTAHEVLWRMLYPKIGPGERAWRAIKELDPEWLLILLANEDLRARFGDLVVTTSEDVAGLGTTIWFGQMANRPDGSELWDEWMKQAQAIMPLFQEERRPVTRLMKALPEVAAGAPWTWAETWAKGQMR
jgi:hypothetical protein